MNAVAGKRPVLVVGAGPVGLTATAFLAQFGTPVKIIDSNAAPTVLSKALVLWRRSIMTLDPLVPHKHWLTVGCAAKGIYFGDEGALARRIDLSNPLNASNVFDERDGRTHELPAGYFVSQGDTEVALVDVLQQKYGISVHRNTKLASFKVSDDGQYVDCVLESSGPGDQLQQEHIQVSHLFACDGGRSTVRKQMGLNFKGATLPQRWWLADAKFEVQDGINPHRPQQEVERVPVRAELQIFTTPVGTIGLFPIAGREGLVRIVWNVDSLGPTQVTLDDFQQLIMDHTRLQIKLTEATWINEFKINERQVDNYVQAGGRVLFAGDAAHVHSPAGGQGMNTGIQDAANLAWKLALVAAGEAAAGPQLLDTYNEERWPIGAAVIRNSGLILRGNAGVIMRSYIVRMLRLLALRVLTSLPMVRQLVASTLAEDTIAYPNSSLAVPAASPHSDHRSSSSSSTVPDTTASAAAKAVWDSCKPGYGFPDVSVMIDGEPKPAIELLRSAPGSFGTLVVLAPSGSTAGALQSQQEKGSEDVKWPVKWGHWRLNVVHVQGQHNNNNNSDSNSGDKVSYGGAADKWGLLRAAVGGRNGEVGVLVRPDGIVAAVGGAEVIDGWLQKHVTAETALAM